MGLPHLSIRRPVTMMMFWLGVVLLGFISWQRLPQELFPPIVYPQITVATYYKDAAPEEMEILVTKPIEEAVGTVSGLKKVSSISKEELSLVFAEFDWSKNMDMAGLAVREKIDLIKQELPRGSEDPVVVKYNPFQRPVMVLNVSSPKMSDTELLKYCRDYIKNELEKMEGVASITISGGLEREVLAEVDAGRLQASNLSVLEVSDALSKANLNYPAGTIKEAFYEYLIRTLGEFEVVPEIAQVPVSLDEGKPYSMREGTQEDRRDTQDEEKKILPERRLILLKDVGAVKDTQKERTSISRFNGKDSVSLSIQKKTATNTVAVVNSLRKGLAKIKQGFPPGMRVDITYDQSEFIKSSIAGVRDAALLGGVLAFLVLYFFLRNVTSALIVCTTIPISILATFSCMYFRNITLNMISLGGLALGVGMLVDNGIVVVENVFRHRELGGETKTASSTGAQEMTEAITGSTLTTIVVFLPMIFTIGIAGQIFKELAFTVVVSLAASLVVALTLIPILSLTIKAQVVRLAAAEETHRGLLKVMADFFSGLLRRFLGRKTFWLGVMTALLFVSLMAFIFINKEFMPKVDQGQFMINVTLSPGARLEVTDNVVRAIEDKIKVLPDVKNVGVIVGSTKEKAGTDIIETLGSNQGRIIVNLKKRHRLPSDKVIQNIKNSLAGAALEGAEIEYIAQESIFAEALQRSAPLLIEIKGNQIETLRRLSTEIQGKLTGVEGIYGVRDTWVPPSPEIKVNIDKDKAALYGLSVNDIALTAQAAVKGIVATKFKEAGKEIDVRLRFRKEDRKDQARVRRLMIRSPLGVMVPLSEVAYLALGKGPTEIHRKDQQRILTVTANIFKRGFGHVQKDISGILSSLNVPAGYTVALGGESEQMQESFASLRFALILSVILVYMIMAAQFESLWQPFVVMFTIPLSLIGVAVALFVTGSSFNVMVILGIIILGGIVVNNGIVLIDCINRLRREQGKGLLEAASTASRLRLRPILMTAGTTVLGLIPLALGILEGTELQVPMAITVMGGLTLSTVLSLAAVPTIYVLMATVIEKKS